MKTFSIVEQKTRDIDTIYDDFKTDYLNPLITVNEICSKYNLSNSNYKHLRKRVREETGIEIKPNYYHKSGFFDNPNKYIQKQGNRYVIIKTINRKKTYFGGFKRIEDARRKRDELIENNWVEIK